MSEEPLDARVVSIVAEILRRDIGLQGEETFFDLGVDSLAAIRIIGRLREELGVPLTVAALFEQPTPRLLAERIHEIRRQGEPSHRIEPLPSREGPQPLSYEQQAIWFHDQLAPKDQINCHDQDVIRVELARPLDRGALDRALATVIERHEPLRTTYESVGGLPKQRVGPAPAIELAYSDLQGLVTHEARAPEGRAGREGELESITRSLAAMKCDLKRGPLLRAHLATLSDTKHVLLAKIHQIAFDGWSALVFARDLSVCYDAYVAGGSPDLPALPLNYADYAADQRRGEETGRFAPALGYWRERLANATPGSIPTDRPRPKRATYRAASIRWSLEPSLTHALRARGKREGTTLFNVLASAVGSVVSNAGSSEDIVLGMLTAGRPDRRLYDLVGCFLNVLPLRLDVTGSPSPSELIQRTKRAVTDAFAHDAPFHTILQALARPRTEAPLVDVSIVMEVPTDRYESQTRQAFTVDWLMNDHEPATAPSVVFMFIQHGEELTCRIVYKVDLFDAARMEQVRARFVEQLNALGG